MREPEHILLIAFAYAPGRGSEPGIGWNMAHALARRYRVTVVTRPGQNLPTEPGLEVVEISPILWPTGFAPSPGSSMWQLYYYAWTRALSAQLPAVVDRLDPDLVQHVTYMRYWMPSAADTAGRPFVWGPVGGGEGMPDRFISTLPPHVRRAELLRDTVRATWERDPALVRTAHNATVALATTPESAARMEVLMGADVPVCPGVGLTPEEFDLLATTPAPGEETFEILSIGRLLDWKGYDLAVEAMAELPQSVRYTIVGDGPERGRLEALAAQLGVSDRVAFTGWMDRSEVLKRVAGAHTLMHPSYHDSGGMVCLEAMAASRPVITLEGNGPAVLTGPAGLPVAAPTREGAVRGIRRAVERLADDRVLRQHLGQTGQRRVRDHFLWDRRVDALAPHFDRALTGGRP
ncbi:MAG: glycosyltransferase involved in cell wall biosynthesis [Rhodothermales bacterium]|jgi:glycosyltransferase involved in cell wall biosynthesis